MKIAVVGCGIAGTAVAWQLAKQGHRLTLFEQAEKCGPVGAGILLQPSGQAVLQRFGLLDAVLQSSPKINSLHAKHRSGSTLVYLPYRKVSDQLFGVGVLRSRLFDLLFEKCTTAGVEIRTGQQIVAYNQDQTGVSLQSADESSMERFELLIAADGSRSKLRQHSGLTSRVKEYPDAALWTVGPYSGPQDCLQQIVGRCGRLVGMLPVGDGRCSFFWGLKKTEEPSLRAAGINTWKRQVAEFLPAAEESISKLTSFDQVPFATYRTARMKSVVDGRVAFVGDAAHAMSPHLGQGLNLALEDAISLTDQMSSNEEFRQAFHAYETQRRSITRFYGALTGTLTPYFQTSNRILQFGRDIALPVMPHLPFVGKQMVYTMAGLKTGWLGATTNAN